MTFDVKTAFLNADLEEEIYMYIPEGNERNGFICRLNKSLYGLRQASRKWNQKFVVELIKLGFRGIKWSS